MCGGGGGVGVWGGINKETYILEDEFQEFSHFHSIVYFCAASLLP